MAAVVLSALLLVACITRPILDVENVPVLTPTNKPLTAGQVRGAILRAGVALGWVVRDAGPDKLPQDCHTEPQGNTRLSEPR